VAAGIRKESGHLCPPQLLAQHNLAPPIDRVHLKDVFGQINTHSRNIHGGRSHSR
jgi:hypothetical protein